MTPVLSLRMESLGVEPKASLENQLCQYLYDQCEDKSPLCDISVSFSADCTFKFHKAILALQSHYFQTLFQGHFPESKAKELTIDVCNNVKDPCDVMHSIVAFIYGQPFTLPAKYVSDVLWVAEYLGIDHCWTWCEKMLYIQLALDNALTIWSLASMFCMTELEQTCQEILISRMQDYYLQQNFLLECDFGLLQMLPSCGLLRFVSQSARADFVVKWANHDMSSRKDQIGLLSQKWGLRKEPLKRALTHSSLTTETGADLLGMLKESPSGTPLPENEDSVLTYVLLSDCFGHLHYVCSEPTRRYTSCNEWISDVFVPKESRKPELLLYDPLAGVWLNAPDVLQSSLVQADWSHLYSSCLFTEKKVAVNKQTRVLLKNSDIYLIHTFNCNAINSLPVLRYSSSNNTIAIFKFWPSFYMQLESLPVRVGGDIRLDPSKWLWCIMAAEFGESCLYVVVATIELFSRCVQRVYLCTIPLPLNEERCGVLLIPVEEYFYLSSNPEKAAQGCGIQLIVLKGKLIFSYRSTQYHWGPINICRLHFVCYDITRDAFYEYHVPDVTEYPRVSVSAIPEKNLVHLLTGNIIRSLDVRSGVWQENIVLNPSPVDCVIRDCYRYKPNTTETPESKNTEVDWNTFIKNPWCLTGECKINRAEAHNTAAYCLDKGKVAWVGTPAPYVNRLVERGVTAKDSSWKHLTPPPAHYITSLSRVSVSRSLLSVLEPATYKMQFKSDYRPFGMCCPDLDDYTASEVVLSSRLKAEHRSAKT